MGGKARLLSLRKVSCTQNCNRFMTSGQNTITTISSKRGVSSSLLSRKWPPRVSWSALVHISPTIKHLPYIASTVITISPQVTSWIAQASKLTSSLSLSR